MGVTKTPQPETTPAAKQRGYRFWLIRFALPLGLSLIFYYDYCWGIWGRNSLLLQYLFQCSCPPASGEARYPMEVDVIIPACRYTSIRLLPSGRFLYVRDKSFWFTSTFLLDLQTNEKTIINLPTDYFYFLTDNLIYVSSGEGYILDWTEEKQYPIQMFAYLYPEASVDGNTNLRLLAEALRSARYVFLINDNDTIIALASDFPALSEHSFVTGWFDIPGLDRDRVEQFLHEYGILYQSVSSNFPSEALSPDSRFIARNDGIYFAETNQKIVNAYPSRLRGWIYDSRGAIYSSNGPCLIQTNFGFLDDSACFFQVPQPVLLLKAPEEYLSPREKP